MDEADEADEAGKDDWPSRRAPRRSWRFLAVWRPVRAVWRGLPRLARIGLATAVIGSATMVVPAIALGTVAGEPTVGTVSSSTERFLVIDAAQFQEVPGVYAKGVLPLGNLNFGPDELTSSVDFTPADPLLVIRSTGGCAGALPTGVTLRITLTINGVVESDTTCAADYSLTALTDSPPADLGSRSVWPARAFRAMVTVAVTPAGAAVPPGSFTLLGHVPSSR